MASSHGHKPHRRRATVPGVRVRDRHVRAVVIELTLLQAVAFANELQRLNS